MKPISMSEIPEIGPETVGEEIKEQAMDAIVDGRKAKIFVSVSRDFYSSEKIVILWNSPHERWGEAFTTKYYGMLEPGKLVWGHEEEVFDIFHP